MAIEIDLNTYQFSEGESFLVDTNVWIYLFSPYSTNNYGYQNFLNDSQNQKCKLFVNSQIISEYINVICRSAYQSYIYDNGLNRRNFQYKKDYQQTTDFKEIYKIACESVRDDILSKSKILPIKLWHIKSSLKDFNTMNDFNDLLYIKMLAKKIKIVSHDNDFRNYPEDIVWLHY